MTAAALFLASWVVWAAEKGLPLPARALPWARGLILADVVRYQHFATPAPAPAPRPAPCPWPLPRPDPIPPPDSEPPPAAGYASTTQIAAVHVLLYDAAEAGAIQQSDPPGVIRKLGSSPTVAALREVLHGMLLDLAGRGYDNLYRDAAALELELSGEGPKVCNRLRSGTWRIAGAAGGAA